MVKGVTPEGEGDFGNTARKEMIKKARGELIAFVDDDNVILPEFLEEMIRAINCSGKDFAVCDVIHFGPLDVSTGMIAPVVLKGEPVKLKYVDPLQVVVRANVMKQIGWDTKKGYLSDGVTLEELGNTSSHVKIDKVLGIHM